MDTINPLSPKPKAPFGPDLAPLQVQAIKELDKLLHPPTMLHFLNNSSRAGWAQLDIWINSLKDLLPSDHSITQA